MDDSTAEPPGEDRGGAGPERRLRGLYLFSGLKRSGDMREHLVKEGKTRDIKVEVTEYDILRCRRHDLTKSTLKRHILAQISAGRFDFVLASPPCSTFSRARKMDSGPRPVRSAKFPRGLPWLTGAAAASVHQANMFVEFSATALRLQAKRGGGILIEHPEDLGRRRGSDATSSPTSMWRWPQLRSLLAVPGVFWGALHLADFGVPHLKPTRLLTNFDVLKDILQVGDPRFDQRGFYMAP